MLLIDPENNYPRFIGDLRLDHPNWEQGDALPEGWHEVTPISELPTKADDEAWQEDAPILVDGKYVQQVSVRPMTDEEKAFAFAPQTAKQKLIDLGFTEQEIAIITRGVSL